MKIAFENSIPSQASYFRLFESTGWNEVYRLDEAQLYDAVRQSWFAVSAYDQDELVGFGRIISDGVHHAFIVDLMVLPAYRNRGIGSNILKLLLAECKARRIRDVQLFSGKGKHGFYRKFGFVERQPDAPGMQWKRAGEYETVYM